MRVRRVAGGCAALLLALIGERLERKTVIFGGSILHGAGILVFALTSGAVAAGIGAAVSFAALPVMFNATVTDHAWAWVLWCVVPARTRDGHPAACLRDPALGARPGDALALARMRQRTGAPVTTSGAPAALWPAGSQPGSLVDTPRRTVSTRSSPNPGSDAIISARREGGVLST